MLLGSQEAEWGSEVGGRERGEVEREESEEPEGSCVQCLPGRAGDTGGSRLEPLSGRCRGRMEGGRDCWGNTGSISGGRDSRGDL